MRIPFVNPGLQYKGLRKEILNIFDEISLTGNYVLGKELEQFERNFAEHIGTKFSVAFNSATSALHAAVVAVGVKPGEEVIVPSARVSLLATCFPSVTQKQTLAPKSAELTCALCESKNARKVYEK